MLYPNASAADNDEIDWLRQEKDGIDPSTGKPVTWKKLGKALGINESSLSLLGTGQYNAPIGKFAETIRQYRAQQVRREEYVRGRIKHPGYVEMPMARRIWGMLSDAHAGEFALICSNSGFSKSYVAREYQRRGGANVFIATLDETTSKLGSMVATVLKALGGQPRNSTNWMSNEVKSRLSGAKALLIVDEAGCGDGQCLEQLRHWKDMTGCGLALLGNHDLHLTVAGARRSGTFARLNSRIDVRMPLEVTLEEDIPIYLSAYGIEDMDVRKMLTRIGLNPRCGGLREIDKTIRNASIIASSEQSPIRAAHILAAMASRGLKVDGSPT